MFDFLSLGGGFSLVLLVLIALAAWLVSDGVVTL